jgi:hypothetical protein
MMRGRYAIPMLLLFFLGFILSINENAPGLWNDIRHYNNFILAAHAEIKNVECTNWNYVMFHKCKVTISEPNGYQILYENRFGRFASENFVLLQDQMNPTIFTTNIGLKTLNNRITYFLIMDALGGLFLVIGSIIVVRKNYLTPKKNENHH